MVGDKQIGGWLLWIPGVLELESGVWQLQLTPTYRPDCAEHTGSRVHTDSYNQILSILGHDTTAPR